MSKFFLPTTQVEDWRKLLADPEKHWRTGYSAKALASCWEDAQGFPPEIKRLFSNSPGLTFHDIELLLAFPEWQVPLPGGGQASQNDIFIIGKANGELVIIMVEGKVSEKFGPTMGEWLADASRGKIVRLDFLKSQLGLERIPDHIRYQLIHRTASAVMEAKRFNARAAAMIVHSFSQTNQWVEDFEAFMQLYQVSVSPGELVFVKEVQGVKLYCGWVKGEDRFLKREKVL